MKSTNQFCFLWCPLVAVVSLLLLDEHSLTSGRSLPSKLNSFDRIVSIINKPRPVYGAGRKLQPTTTTTPNPIGYSLQPKQRHLSDNSDNENPKPYSFSFDHTDEYNTRMARQEQQDSTGTVTGFYSYRDANGMFRRVEYVADGQGFRAYVKSNEPGTWSSVPAKVLVKSSV